MLHSPVLFFWALHLRILQLTDLHVFAQPEARLKGIPTRECLQDVVRYIQQNELPFDHVVVTGDHTHDELHESYQVVWEILSGWQDRLHVVPGNHDDRVVLRDVFGKIVSGTGQQLINFEFHEDHWQFLGLDTHVPGEVPGLIEQSQIDWLQQRLQSSDAANTALFFHHPPVDVKSVWMDSIGLKGRVLLQSVIQSTPRIRLVCCGHVHHDFHATLGNADVFTTPSTGIQFDPAGSVATFAADAPGYRVLEISGADFTTKVGRLPKVKYTPVND